jgi:hypothetical protein
MNPVRAPAPAAGPRGRLLDWLAWAAARLGRPGQAGLVMVALAAALCLGWVSPLERDSGERLARAERLARQPPAPVASVPDWRASLPTGHVGHAHLARLFQAASAHGLRLEEGRYRDARDARTGLTRLSIVLPVSGPYPALRAFLAQALNGGPGLALEGLRLSREDMAGAEVEAEVRFVLLVGDRP